MVHLWGSTGFGVTQLRPEWTRVGGDGGETELHPLALKTQNNGKITGPPSQGLEGHNIR